MLVAKELIERGQNERRSYCALLQQRLDENPSKQAFLNGTTPEYQIQCINDEWRLVEKEVVAGTCGCIAKTLFYDALTREVIPK